MTKLTEERIKELWHAHLEQWPEMHQTLISPVVFARAIEAELQPDFCDKNCTWRDHHPDCERAEPVVEHNRPMIAAILPNGAIASNVYEAYEEGRKSVQPVQEPVLYQYRWTNPLEYKNQPKSLLDWQPVKPGWNQTMQDKADELRSESTEGRLCYEVRALYTVPPDQANKLDLIAATEANDKLNELCRDQTAEIERLRHDLMVRETVKDERIATLETEIERLQKQKFRKFREDECWIYQGDGEDNLQSLVCPVVIAPDKLMALNERITELETALRIIKEEAESEKWNRKNEASILLIQAIANKALGEQHDQAK
jgi:hypothetical protein